MSDPLNLQLKHFIDELRVFITLGDSAPIRTRSCPRVTKLLWTLESLYCPLIHGDLIVETEHDLGDHSQRIRVERDSSLCELLNRDVGNFSDWLNFRNKSCDFYTCSFRFTYYSCLVFDLTLCVIPSS
jgi:hypothetical protein